MTKIAIRPADLEADRDLLIATLFQHLTLLSNDRRYEWLYMNSPYGQARVWIAVDADNGMAVGVASAFPRRVYIDGREELAWVLGDFCVDDRYRSLGPAVQLQRACLSAVNSGAVAFCYDFPSASMVAVYKRLGFSMTGKMLRLAKPLRVDRKVKSVIKNPAAQRIAASIGNAFLRMTAPKETGEETLEISIQDGPCDEEFAAFMHEQRGRLAICLQRSAEHLNWRYVNNPLARYEFITARRRGNLRGYAVWTQAGEDASVVDLFGEEDPGMLRRLIGGVVALAQNRGVMTLSVSVNESHPWLSLFSEMGFRLRDSTPMMIIPSNTFAGKIDPQLSGWYLMQGDRDS